MCHASKLTNPLLPLPPLHLITPLFSLPNFQTSPTRSSLLLHPSLYAFISLVPSFKAHHPFTPSSPPPICDSSFLVSHPSKLTNPFLPLPPLQLVSPHL